MPDGKTKPFATIATIRSLLDEKAYGTGTNKMLL
jgi:hypothetical protein